MQHDDRPLLDGQASERPVELVAVVDGHDVVPVCRSVDRQDADVPGPLPATPGLGVAGVDEEAANPRFEAIRVAQPRKLSPGGDEAALQGILGEMHVAQDPRRDREHPVAGQADQHAERVVIAAHRPLDDVSHPHSFASQRRARTLRHQ
jgi:hypothetical protein